MVGVGDFPLCRASLSPNGGVAGFKQTLSAVARMIVTGEEDLLYYDNNDLSCKEKLPRLFMLPARFSTGDCGDA